MQAAEPAVPVVMQVGAMHCGERAPGDTRPRIGLALGGGGARGIAHVRILKQLEALHFPVDCIAGTSAGALVGALYASGSTPAQIEQLVLSTEWLSLFTDTLPRRDRSLRRKADDYAQLAPIGIGLGGEGKAVALAAGVSEGEKLIALFERATGGSRVSGRFDDLPIPFRAVATDINTGKPVVLAEGSVAMAMRASMSLPGIFRPVVIQDQVLLDGGLSNQVPIDVVRAMGADRVIAVDVGTPLSALDRDASLVDVISQLSGFLTTRSAQQQLDSLGQQDLLIAPDLTGKVATGDFDKAPEALQIGQVAAERAAPALLAFAQPPETYDRLVLQRAQRERPVGSDRIAFVEVDNHTGYADALLLSYFPVEIGAPLDVAAMQDGVLRAYGMGTLASINYEVKRRDGRTGVVVSAYAKPNGPAYLEAGLSLSNDLEGGHQSNLRAGLLFSPLSAYGAEARVVLQIGNEPALTGQYYHPFDLQGRYAFQVGGGFQTRSFNLYDDDGNKTALYRVRRTGATVAAVRNVSNVLALTAGVERYRGNAKIEVGDPSIPRVDFEEGAWIAQATLDDIDSLYFPRDGYLVNAGTYQSSPSLGADARFGQLDLDAVAARSFGKHAVQLGLRYHVTSSGEAPVQNLYRLGGRWRLAGFQHNELTGQDYALGFAGYTYELGKLLGRSAQVGGTVEYGNAWQRRSDMSLSDGIWNGSLFLGFDSWIGPLIFGMGFREGGRNVIFIELGQSL
ncbi:patatin-like phospholipase family protein [Stenotrophomonas rhizophila]|uniref:NTE family protein n=1 Tax=Stenotrophomonas rhizophila TaxID=216778 RepID=A0AAW5PFD5_9GAMM|nr:patatin-like phospholipase family protein [Stenotrophomonas rhizophila]MCS4279098.1 NTE family protein [Stenotrophomonas rhizophila]